MKESHIGEDVKQVVAGAKTAIVEETKNAVNLIKEQINDPQLKQNIKEFGDKVADGAKQVDYTIKMISLS